MKPEKVLIYVISLIYIAILFIDSFGNGNAAKYSTYLKFAGVLLCFVMTLNIKDRGYSKTDVKLLQGALLFTITADFLLLIQNKHLSGVSAFCIVQSLYIIRHNREKRKVIAFLLFAVLLISLSVINNVNNKLYFIAVLYSALLIISVLSGVKTARDGFYSKTTSKLIMIGLFLFILCDINVAIFNLLPKFTNISGFLIWFFYLPSQMLLALSGYKIELKVKHR